LIPQFKQKGTSCVPFCALYKNVTRPTMAYYKVETMCTVKHLHT